MAQAEAELAQAEQRMDVDATIAAKTRVSVLKDFITRLESEQAREVEAAAKKAAEERCVAISRAHGGLLATLEADEQNLDACARAYAAAATRANEHYDALTSLEAENCALVDRFGVSGAKLPRVIAPSQRAACVAASRTLPSVALADDYVRRPSTEMCEHRLRERRDYEEIAGTQAHTIIATVGPKPWRQLTERERRVVEAASSEVTVGSMVARRSRREFGAPGRRVSVRRGSASRLNVSQRPVPFP